MKQYNIKTEVAKVENNEDVAVEQVEDVVQKTTYTIRQLKEEIQMVVQQITSFGEQKTQLEAILASVTGVVGKRKK